MNGDDMLAQNGSAPLRLMGVLPISDDLPLDVAGLLGFLGKFQPVRAIGVTKTRVGADGDGGYVMLDDLEDPLNALSLGVGEETSWDNRLAETGAIIHQYDHTVPPPMNQSTTISFHGKRIADTPDMESVTLLQALHSLEVQSPGRRAILKIDIEGDEWSVLDAAPDDVLEKFDQIVCELHGFENIGDANWLERASRVAVKLDRFFGVVHVHGNNFRPLFTVNQVVFPWVLEVTYANRSRYQFMQSDERFPTELDRPNNPSRPDIWLGTLTVGQGDNWLYEDQAKTTDAASLQNVEFLAAERAGIEMQFMGLQAYEASFRASEHDFEVRYHELTSEASRLHAVVAEAHRRERALEAKIADFGEMRDQSEALVDSLKKESIQSEALANSLKKESIRSDALIADLRESVTRSKSAAAEAHNRYLAICSDYEEVLLSLDEERKAKWQASAAHKNDLARFEASSEAAAREADGLKDRQSDLLNQRQSLTAKVTELERNSADLCKRLAVSEDICQAYRASTSWRITRPLRMFARSLKRM